MQDSMGFIWFGTNHGLFRYDGHNLVQVDIPRTARGHRRVRSICEDSSGDIWAGTNSGLIHYRRKSGKTEVFRGINPMSVSITKVIALPSGKIALGSFHHGAWILDPATQVCQSIEGPEGFQNETPCICLGKEGMLYIRSSIHGFLQVDPSRGIKAEKMTTVSENPFPGIVIPNIEYYNGRIIAGSADRTCIIDVADGDISWRSWSVVNAIESAPENGCYMATNTGVLEIGPDLEPRRIWYEDFDDPNALHDKNTRSICKDNDGNLWVGTNYSGAYVFQKNFADMKFFSPDFPDSPYGRRIREIVEDEGGILWIGSENSGLMRYDIASGQFSRVPLPLLTHNILGLCIEGPYLWIGSYSRTDPTLRLDRRTLRTKAYPGLPKGIASIFKGDGDNVFLSDDQSIYVYNTKADSLRLFGTTLSASSKYTNNIYSKNGELWIGGAEDCLYRYSKGSVSPVKEIILEDDEGNSLPLRTSASPRLVDSEGKLWCSIGGIGLIRMDLQTGHARHYDFPESFGTPVIKKMLQDREGIIWIVSSRSLLVLDPENGEFFKYDKDDGLLSGEFNDASGLIASDGKLYTGLMDGMVSFDPVKFRNYPCKTRQPVFSGLDLMHSPSERTSSDSLDFAPFYGEGTITLKAFQNAFTVSVSEMNYSIPHRSNLVYSLDDGRHWSEVLGGKIELSRLPSGRYNLRVRSKMSDGSLDDKESLLKIRILVPLLASTPFIVLYILLFVLILYTIVITTRRRSIKKTTAKARLEAEMVEARRQQELWASKVNFLNDMAHEIRTPLSLIKAPVESLETRLGKSADATVRNQIALVSRNADKLSSIMEQLLTENGRRDYISPERPDEVTHPAERLAEITVRGARDLVLLVEKDAEMRQFLTLELEKTLDVAAARAAEDVWNILEKATPDAIVCDIDSGGSDAYLLVSKLKSDKTTETLPMIVLSDLQDQKSKVWAMQQGAEAFFSKPFSISELTSALDSLLDNRRKLRASLSEKQGPVPDEDFLPRLQSILKARLHDESFNVEQFASEAYMSLSSLFKKLKAATGMSPGEYITAFRMKEAARLMKDRSLTVDEISIRVGFSSQSYFSTCFKKHFGMSPKKYRQLSEPSTES